MYELVLSVSGVILIEEKQNIGRETSPGTIVSTTNSMLTGLEPSAGIRYKRRPTDTFERLGVMTGYC
jgi:hypothetical protein